MYFALTLPKNNVYFAGSSKVGIARINIKIKPENTESQIKWYTIDHRGDMSVKEIDSLLEVYERNRLKTSLKGLSKAELSQLNLIRGMLLKEDGEESLYRARQYGFECLQENTAFASFLVSSNDEIKYRHLKYLKMDEIMHACASWATAAWANLLILRGAGSSSLDTASIRAMAKWTWTNTRNRDPGWAGYSYAMSFVLEPEVASSSTSRDFDQMAEGFAAALDSNVASIHWELDYVEYYLLKTSKTKNVHSINLIK